MNLGSDACRFLAALLAVCSLGVAPLARAQSSGEPSAQDRAVARHLFEEGVRLMDEQRHEEAAERFRRASELVEAATILFNLAVADAHVGRLLEAVDALRRLELMPGVEPFLADNARTRRQEIEPRLAHVVIELSGPSEGVEVRFDDDLLPSAALGAPAPTDPGEHRVVATRDGEIVASRELSLVEGQRESVTLEIPPPVPPPEVVAEQVEPPSTIPAAVPAAVPAAALEGDGDDAGVLIGVSVGVGAVVLLTAAILIGVAASGGFDSTPPHCGNADPCVIIAP